jgi:hypothetical protein
MTEQKFKVGDEVFYCPGIEDLSFSIWPAKVTSMDGEQFYVIEDELFEFNAHFSEISPTREAAEAALIEKLEKALEEAKGL